jgi:hypothetical protein
MIAEALLAISQGRAGPPGRYDLVNEPQWTWRDVYCHEAAALGVPLKITESPNGTEGPSDREAVHFGHLSICRSRAELLSCRSDGLGVRDAAALVDG